MIEPTLSAVKKLVPSDLASYHGEFRCVQNGDVYQIVYTDVAGQINCITSKNMQKFLRSSPPNVAKLKTWQLESLQKDPSEELYKFTSTKRMGVVVFSGAALVFWIDTADNTVCAARFTPGKERRIDDWCAVVVKGVAGQASQKMQVSSGGISATLSGEGQVLLSYLEKKDPVSGSSRASYAIRHVNLSLGSWDAESNEWLSDGPSWSQDVPTVLTNDYGGKKTSVDFDVRVIATAVPMDDFGNTSVNYLFAALWLPDYAPDRQTASPNNKPLIATFAYCATETFDGAKAGVAPVLIQWGSNSANNYRGDGIFVAIDPVGRLVCSFADRSTSGRLAIGVIEDLKPLRNAATKPATTPPTYSTLTWATHAVKFDDETSGDIRDSDGLVAMVFTVNPYGAEPPTVPEQTYPLLLSFLWPRVTSDDPDAPILMATMTYANLVTSTNIYPPKADSYKSKNFLTTICDPFPMPIPLKLIATDVPSGMADWLLFEYQLLSGQSHVFIEDMSWRAGVTLQMDFQSAIPGFRGGAGFTLGGGITIDRQSKVTKYETRGFTVQSKAYATPYKENYPNFRYHDAPYLIRPYGAFSARALFYLKEVVYTTSSLAYATDEAPQVTSIYGTAIDPGNDDTVVGDFFTYTCVPGDLESYTKEAIDKRMRELFAALPACAKAEFKDEDGQDLSPYYTEGSYVDQVLAAFGTQLTIDKSEYIPFALSGSSVADGSYTLSSSKSEGFGGYLDGSVYMSGLFGNPDKDFTNIKVTFNFNFTRNVTTIEETSYNIGMKTYINPLASTQAFSTRLYRLKKSRLWALELKHFPAIARRKYMDHLRQCPNDATKTLIPDAEPVPEDLTDIITDSNSLLFDQSSPNRVMFIVTRWVPGKIATNATQEESTVLNLPISNPLSVVIASADDTTVVLEAEQTTIGRTSVNCIYGVSDPGPNPPQFTLIPGSAGNGDPIVQIKSDTTDTYFLHVYKDNDGVFHLDLTTNSGDERTQWYLEASPDDRSKYSLRNHVTKTYLLLDRYGRVTVPVATQDNTIDPPPWNPPSSWLRLLDIQGLPPPAAT